MSLYDSNIPFMRCWIKALSAILAKANAEGDFSKLIEARLVPDMLPLQFQVAYTTGLFSGLNAHILGAEPKSLALQDLKTYEDCEKAIAKALESLDSIDKAKFDACANETNVYYIGPNSKCTTTGAQFITSYLMPNLSFHVVTAYNILRKEDINLGKKDFIMPFGLFTDVKIEPIEAST